MRRRVYFIYIQLIIKYNSDYEMLKLKTALNQAHMHNCDDILQTV